MASNEEPLVSETTFHVRSAETDAMGVVHHANYLIYFEEGRSHFMREMGSDYALMEASGYQLPVTETSLRYVGSLRYGQKLKVRTWLEENRSRRITFAYQVLSEDSEQILVSGITRHVWTDSHANVTRAPKQWTNLFSQG
jgi:acyl-CoA thioester hydrolase